MSNTGAISNYTNVSTILRPTRSELDSWFATTMCIGGLGGISIAFLLTVMVTSKKAKTTSGQLIIHLESVELFMCVVQNLVTNVPLYVKLIGYNVVIHCGFAHFGLLSLSFVANWAATVLAINRFLAIMLPFQYRNLTGRRNAVTMLLWPWFIVLITNIPLYLQRDINIGMLSSGACGVLRVTGKTLMIVGILNSYVPYAIIGVSYISIFMKQKLVCIRAVPDDHAVRPAVLNKRLAMAKVLFCSFLWYCLCLLPAPVVDTFAPDVRHRDTRFVMWLRTTWVLGYAVNPLFFFVMSREYRANARMLLDKLGRKNTAGPTDENRQSTSKGNGRSGTDSYNLHKLASVKT